MATRKKKRVMQPSETYEGRAAGERPLVSITISQLTLERLNRWAVREGGRGRVVDRLAEEEAKKRGE